MKKEYILLGAAALIGAYVLMPKGEEAGPGGSGGLGAGLGGLPGIPGSGGGGSDTPTVNIDFPNLPAFVPEEPPLPGETKKEAATKSYDLEDIWSRAISRGYQYDQKSDMLLKDLGEGQTGHYAKTSFGTSGSWDETTTKKEDAITSVWDLRLFGKSREQQMKMAPSLFQKAAPRTETFSSNSKLFVNKSPTPVQWSTSGLTKKESSISSGSGTSTYATRTTPKPVSSAGGPMISFINNQGRFF